MLPCLVLCQWLQIQWGKAGAECKNGSPTVLVLVLGNRQLGLYLATDNKHTANTKCSPH